MTLAAENIALKAENARLREALAKYATGYDFIKADVDQGKPVLIITRTD